MAKVELKTRPTDASVDAFIAGVENAVRRTDAYKVLDMMKRVTGLEPVMWGTAIIGFGSVALKYSDGRQIDWPIIGFSPRKQNLSLYVICNSPRQEAFLKKLGKHTSSVSCLYINKLADIDESVLNDIVSDAFDHVKKRDLDV